MEGSTTAFITSEGQTDSNSHLRAGLLPLSHSGSHSEHCQLARFSPSFVHQVSSEHALCLALSCSAGKGSAMNKIDVVSGLSGAYSLAEEVGQNTKMTSVLVGVRKKQSGAWRR